MTRPLRVLSISTLYPTAARPGFGLFVARQAEAVARTGTVELIVVAPQARAPRPFTRLLDAPAQRALPDSARDRGLVVHYPRYDYVRRICTRWSAALIARAVLPLAQELRPDVIDAQYFYPDGPVAARIARALDLPLTIKARGSDIQHWGDIGYARPEILAAADQAAGMLAVSGALRQAMIEMGIDGTKVAVHYTGLDHTTFHPTPRAVARQAIVDLVPGDGPLLACVGNLVPIKGQALAIEALAALPGTRLVLAGKGPDEAALRALVRQLDLSDRVHMAGSLPAERLALLLSAADALVLPSEREGLANAWIEALACGTPLVIPDVGGAREVVREAAAGRIVAREPVAIAEAVRDLLAAAPVQEEVAAFAARFSWEENARQLTAFWRRVAAT